MTKPGTCAEHAECLHFRVATDGKVTWCKDCNTIIKKLGTAPQTDDRELGYVIERHSYNELQYFDGRFTDGRGWSPKHEEAVRFVRFEDADRVLGWLLCGNGRVVQHLWVKPTAAPSSGVETVPIKVKKS